MLAAVFLSNLINKKNMLIPHEFDVAMAERRKIMERNAFKTAEKLNARMMQFLSDIHKNPSLKDSIKKEIRAKLLQHL
jgi:hypothetical protein